MRRKKKDFEDDDIDTSGWLMTYSDMVTLLLTFFILIIAFANYDKTKFWSVIESTRDALGGLGVLPQWKESLQSDLPPDSYNLTEDGEIKNLIEIAQSIKNLNKDIDYKITDKGVAIILPDKFILFDSGSAKIKEEALPTLRQIAEILQKALKRKIRYNDIQIAGHADNRPIHTSEFADNWELSAARATNVLRLLVNYGLDKSHLSAVGYADQRPVAPNDTEEGKTKNRRIEIEIIKAKRPH
ncbi:TPA: flagellar motor protein MotB [Candidatus Poribacteria bacterium]|nr:flagellar motor protein MotB [Candidatus Poribacteria bacterium]